jgi:hypothetical protein
MEGLREHYPQLLVVGGFAVLGYLLMRRSALRSKHARENSMTVDRAVPPQKTLDRALLDAPPEVLRWQVEMHETARDLKAEIDTKLLALQRLIQLAREERERLEAAIGQAATLSVGDTNIKPADTYFRQDTRDVGPDNDSKHP